MHIRFPMFFAVVFFFLSLSAQAADLYVIPSSAIIPDQKLRPGDAYHLTPLQGDMLVSGSFSDLTAGRIYLRRKLDARSYGWFEGRITDNAFSALHVFPLKEKGLNAADLRFVKFFGARNAKAFQDEQDIYFDKENIYASRVPVLHFRIGGQWQTLEAQSQPPGLLRIESEPAASIIVRERVVGTTPYLKAPAQPGSWIYTLEAEGYLPITLLSMVISRQATVEKHALPLPDTSGSRRSPVVASAEIHQATNLIQLEKMHDRLDSARQSTVVSDSARTLLFAKSYPSLRLASADLSDSSEAYMQYKELYDKTRDRAFVQWSAGALDSNHLMLSEVRDRIRDFEAQTLRGPARVIAARFEKKDSTGRSGILTLQLQSEDRRLDVAWSGLWKDSLLYGDTLVSHMFDSAGAPRILVTLENKPVWIAREQQGWNRHFYRYLKAELILGEHEIVLQGEFSLPVYISEQPEVQAWLQARKPLAPEPVRDTTPTVRDTLPPPVVYDTAALYKAYLTDYFRGKVVEIPGGHFRYKNKMVEISPFAIHATEVTQLHYERIRQKNASTFKDVQKPVHNIDWYNAKSFCEEIGGNLPTEAQWEFAGRAGSVWPGPWMVDSTQIREHAVYYEIAEAKGKSDSAYGPQEVGKRRANAWGLYDMIGNVAEWTRDNSSWFSFYIEKKDPQGSYFGHFKTFKGGSWKTRSRHLSFMESDDEDPRYWGTSIGMRCVFPADQQPDTTHIKTFFEKRQVVIPPFVIQEPRSESAHSSEKAL